MRGLASRVSSMVGWARITASAALEGKGVRRVQVRFDESDIQDERPLAGWYGFASRPKPGADAVVVYLGGNRGLGIVIATNDRRYQIELDEGEVALHDDLGSRVHLRRSGDIDLAPASGTVNVTGNLMATGDVVAGTISLKTHRHGGVQTGSGNTGAPAS